VEYFWYYRPEENFPPPTIRRPDERRDGDRLAVACTQTNLPAKQQRQLVSQWCEALPKLNDLRWLWLNSRVPQPLFEAACRVPKLKGLWVKWTAAESIASLSHSRLIRYLHLGNCDRVVSFAPLAHMLDLQWLGLEHFPKTDSIDPLSGLTGLVGLSIQGSMLSTQRIKSLEPLRDMVDLRYLNLANVRVDDNSLSALDGMHDLETLILPRWWDQSAVDAIRRANPKLRE
jgi:hypothetical protein